MIDDVESVYNRAIETIETAVIAPHPDSTSCFASRLRPSEEAALIINCYLNPPPPWGIKLNCSSMFWGSEKCVNIAQKLILNHTVTSLDLSMCDLQENEAVVFFSCLRRNTCLKHLCMNGNCIGDKGAVAAAQCVGNLETLHMSCNGICDNGAVALASSLRQSEKIKTLNLRGNRISLYGAYMLVSALEAVLDLFSQNIRSSILAFDFVLCSSSELNSEKLTKEREQMSMDKSDSKDCYVSVRANKEKLNESLHTLWLRHNDGIPEELFKVLDKVLSKRFPQPPKGISKKNLMKQKAL
ncbi:putative leucine-rich repeat protein (LRRP) [Trypanosoma vivax]|uniref:Putative leucine-rich repeat protein (LRRP) n=1 Tax=Trypanosoma vivax (strain Y486) TaxID=1055687 RepID=G0TY83_TRYVY|nr:putative leucine-rich repeat protein (LRRP) [Trypanosoma vivax]CCC48928.1 putative leucine-rich repeat protein (LRRP) [Trypanosoma vivax Y486]